MQSSRSCEEAAGALQSVRYARIEELAARLRSDPRAALGADGMDTVCRGFASLYYSILVREMENTVERDEEGGALRDGVQGFLRTFLPEALAEPRSDPLVRHLREAIESQRGPLDQPGAAPTTPKGGDRVDESV
jgi:hypothetical protein